MHNYGRTYTDSSRLTDVVLPASASFAHGLSTNYSVNTGKDNYAVITPSMSYDRKSMAYGIYFKGTKESWKIVSYNLKQGGFIDELLKDVVDKYNFEIPIPDDIDFCSIDEEFYTTYKLKKRVKADDKVQDNLVVGDEHILDDSMSVVAVSQISDNSSGNKAAAKHSKRVAKQTEKQLDSLQSKVT